MRLLNFVANQVVPSLLADPLRAFWGEFQACPVRGLAGENAVTNRRQ